MESDKRIKIEGEGHLINKDSNKRFPVRFEIEQIHTGKISGKCTLSGFEYEDILSPSQLKNCRCISGELIKIRVYEMQEYILENFRKSSLKGETKNRDEVIINDIFTYACQTNFSESRSERSLDLKFSAGKVEVSCETISTKDQLWIKYGIINLDLRHLLRGCIETDIGKITFSTWKDHEEVIEEMKTFKTPLLSGFIRITDVNIGKFESFDSYFETVDNTVGKVLELLSLAQSTYLSHCSVIIYAKTPNSNSQDDYKLKKLIMLDIKTKAPSLGQPLIRDWGDIYNFISPKTLQKYTDLKEKFGLDIAFEWYLESLSHGVLQSDYLLACTCLELLKDSYNKIIDNVYILSESLYLFSWDNVPGNDSEKLISFLRDDIDIGWAENVKIRKLDDGKTIHISKDKNSAEILIDEKKEKATLKISSGRTHDLKVKKENGKLNIYESLFDKYLPDLKKVINEVLKEKGVNNKKRKKISGNLECINRTIFKNSLLRLLKDYRIIYDDLFYDIQEIIDKRDEIIHTGIQKGDHKELSKIYERLICLIQRIFLALLEYDGYFLDRNDRYKRKKFTDFISGDFARTAEEIPGGENGTR